MNPDFANFVDEAATVKTSGRWDAVNAKIRVLAARPGAGNEWYVQLFGALCYQVFSEYHQLKNAYSAGHENASLLAWRARNLLELSVWSSYFTKDRQHARRLYEDAGRDVLDLLSTFEKWGNATAQSTEWLDPIAGGRRDLSERAADEKIEILEGSYKRVAEAAKDCGMGDHTRSALRCFPSLLIQPPCKFLALPMKQGMLYKRTASSAKAVFSLREPSLPLEVGRWCKNSLLSNSRAPTCLTRLHGR